MESSNIIAITSACIAAAAAIVSVVQTRAAASQADSARVAATAAEKQASDASRSADAAEAQVAHLDREREEQLNDRIRQMTRALIGAVREHLRAIVQVVEHVAIYGHEQTADFNELLRDYKRTFEEFSAASTDLLPLSEQLPFRAHVFLVYIPTQRFMHGLVQILKDSVSEDERERWVEAGRDAAAELREQEIELSKGLTEWLVELGRTPGSLLDDVWPEKDGFADAAHSLRVILALNEVQRMGLDRSEKESLASAVGTLEGISRKAASRRPGPPAGPGPEAEGPSRAGAAP